MRRQPCFFQNENVGPEFFEKMPAPVSNIKIESFLVTPNVQGIGTPLAFVMHQYAGFLIMVLSPFKVSDNLIDFLARKARQGYCTGLAHKRVTFAPFFHVGRAARGAIRLAAHAGRAALAVWIDLFPIRHNSTEFAEAMTGIAPASAARMLAATGLLLHPVMNIVSKGCWDFRYHSKQQRRPQHPSKTTQKLEARATKRRAG
jgi:hypothetical protein